jgi:hypothetical protein
MIVKELFGTRADGVKLYKTYSSENYKILQVETGITYDEAVDVETATYNYIETDEKIEWGENNVLFE